MTEGFAVIDTAEKKPFPSDNFNINSKKVISIKDILVDAIQIKQDVLNGLISHKKEINGMNENPNLIITNLSSRAINNDEYKTLISGLNHGIAVLAKQNEIFSFTIPHINSETNPYPPIINVVCKYLRQFLGTSFGVATLPIYYNIE